MGSDLVALTGCLLLSIGAFGLASSGNLIKQLLSLEVAFNGAILLVSWFLSASPALGTLALVLIAAVAANETIILIILVLARFRIEKSTSTVLEV